MAAFLSSYSFFSFIYVRQLCRAKRLCTMMDTRAMIYLQFQYLFLALFISALENKATLSCRKLRAEIYTVALLGTVLCLYVVIPKIFFSLSSFTPENLVSRDGFGSPVPRQPAHLRTQAESGAYLGDSSRVPRRRCICSINNGGNNAFF